MSTTLTVDFFCSLDGYGMANGWPGYWGKDGPEVLEDRVRTFAQEQVLVFGATTFRQFRQFVVKFDDAGADHLCGQPNVQPGGTWRVAIASNRHGPQTAGFARRGDGGRRDSRMRLRYAADQPG